MALYKFTNGTVANATEVNQDNNVLARNQFLSDIKNLYENKYNVFDQADYIKSGNSNYVGDILTFRAPPIEETVTNSFTEAFNYAAGQNGTVNTGNTTAQFNTGNIHTGTMSEGLFLNPAFIDNHYGRLMRGYRVADTAASGTTETLNIGSTSLSIDAEWVEGEFTASSDLFVKTVSYTKSNGNDVLISVLDKNNSVIAQFWDNSDASGGSSHSFTQDMYSRFIRSGEKFVVRLQTIFSSTSGNTLTLSTNASAVTGTHFTANKFRNSYQTSGPDPTKGWLQSSGTNITVETLSTTASTTNLIEMDLPSGTFSSTINSFYAKAYTAADEAGTTIKHKLKNGSEDSGFFNDGEIASFTAFTSQPTKYQIQIVSKSSSPKGGLPLLLGTKITNG